MSRRFRTTTDDMLEMFRANLVDVDLVEETAVTMRNVFTMSTFALVAAAVLNIVIAFIFAANA